MTFLANNYNRKKISFKKGVGSYLVATNGKKYLDFCSGIAVNSLGHANPRLVKALYKQAKKVWHVSNAFTIPEGEMLAKKLVKTTYEALMKAIKIVKNDLPLGDIGAIIQNYVEAEGFSVVQDFCGHGIGKQFHKEPNVLHYGKAGTGEKIKTGMIFTIEPMINLGKFETKTLNDGWTAVTKDKSLSAQFEHTIGVTKEGCEIFTLPKN